jgi:hypothetical protein
VAFARKLSISASLLVVSDRSWRTLARRDLGVATTMSDVIGEGVNFHEVAVGQLRSASRLFLMSDIGGDHKAATHRAHAFLVTDPDSVARWAALWSPVRRRYLADGRRMSYERLSDRHRLAALDGYLRAADALQGFLITVLIDKRLQLFTEGPPPGEFQGWKREPFRRLLAASHLASILLAGLSASGQDVLWISDEDDFAANDARLWKFCDVFGRVSGHYLPHALGHFRFATSRSDDGSKQIEDLLALPDLAAGWLVDLLSAYTRDFAALSEHVVLPPPSTLREKSGRLMAWCAESGGRLKHVAVTAESNEPQSLFLVRRLRFSTG